MSTPKNHHYVSQIHLKNFFNYEDKKIYVYDKLKDNQYFNPTTKSLFSEKFLNTRYKDGNIEHSSLENDLNKHFEKDFTKHYEVITLFIQHQELNIEVRNALFYFASV